MHSDLMHPSGFQFDFDTAELIAPGEAFVMRNCFLAHGIDPNLRFVFGILDPEQGTPDRIGTLEVAHDEREVFFTHAMLLEFVEQKIQAMPVFGNQQNSRCIAIDAVHERRREHGTAVFSPKIIVRHLYDRHFCCLVIARMDINFGRLVDGEN